MSEDVDQVFMADAFATRTDINIDRHPHVHQVIGGCEYCVKNSNVVSCPLRIISLKVAAQETADRSDLLSLIEMVEGFKQSIAALVAGLVSDGFSDEQARDIVAGFWRITGRPEEKS